MTLDNSATKPSHLVAAPQSSGFKEMNENCPQELSINSNGQLNVVRKCSGRANQNNQAFTSNQLNDHIDSNMSCSTTDSKYGGDVNQPFIHNVHTVISQQAETMRSITESETILRDFINDSNEILKRFMEHRFQHEDPAHTLDVPDSRHKRKSSEGVNSLAHSRGSLTPSNDENGTLEHKKPGSWKERFRASFRRKKSRRPSGNEAGEVQGNSAASKGGKGKRSSGFLTGIKHSLRLSRRSSSGINHENGNALILEQPLVVEPHNDHIDSVHESQHESDSEGPMEAEMPDESGPKSLDEVDAGVQEKPEEPRRFLSIDGNEGTDQNQKKFNEMTKKEKEVLYEKIVDELKGIGDKESLDAKIRAMMMKEESNLNYEYFCRLVQGAISGSGDNLVQEMAVLCSVTAVTISRVGDIGKLMFNRYFGESIAPRVVEAGGWAALGFLEG